MSYTQPVFGWRPLNVCMEGKFGCLWVIHDPVRRVNFLVTSLALGKLRCFCLPHVILNSSIHLFPSTP